MTGRMLLTGAMLLSFAMALRAADDPIVGTWKLNLAKSNTSAAATFKSGAAKIESQQNGLKATTDLVSIQGETIHTEFNAKYDGLDYPVSGDPYSNTISIQRIDANRVYTTWKKDGRVVTIAENVISTDGKTWTETIVTRDGQGRELRIVAVYDKQ
jgi:hypothetical protein